VPALTRLDDNRTGCEQREWLGAHDHRARDSHIIDTDHRAFARCDDSVAPDRYIIETKTGSRSGVRDDRLAALVDEGNSVYRRLIEPAHDRQHANSADANLDAERHGRNLRCRFGTLTGHTEHPLAGSNNCGRQTKRGHHEGVAAQTARINAWMR